MAVIRFESHYFEEMNMKKPIKRIAVNTGGGDAPGLNAVIQSVVIAADNLGWECYGIRDGFNGILFPERYSEGGVYRLTRDRVRGIGHLGGTILGTTNKGNPLHFPVNMPDGTVREIDRSDEILTYCATHEIDALVMIGGDGSLTIADALHQKGMPVVGVPKTIDNDLSATDYTFGYDTALSIATECIDRLHTTADSHNRVIVAEIMGRHAGWIALESGLAGGADVILIPEVPMSSEEICDFLQKRHQRGKNFSIVAVAEGFSIKGEDLVTTKSELDAFGHVQLGGVGERLAKIIEKNTGFETRCTVLGHIQRGGSPTAFDRVLGTRFGVKAFELAKLGKFGHMAALRGREIVAVPLADAVGALKTVPMELYDMARQFFG